MKWSTSARPLKRLGQCAPTRTSEIDFARSIRQTVLFEEIVVEVFDREIQTPKIAAILVGGAFFGRVDDSQLNPVRVRRFDSCEIEQSESESLQHPLFAAHTVVALLNTRPKIEFAPLGLIASAPVIPCFQVVAFEEVDLHMFLPIACQKPPRASRP